VETDLRVISSARCQFGKDALKVPDNSQPWRAWLDHFGLGGRVLSSSPVLERRWAHHSSPQGSEGLTDSA